MHIATRRSYLLTFFLSLFWLAVHAQTANFTVNSVTGCAPFVAQFTNTSTGTNGSTTYSWNLGNSVTSALQNPSTTYTNPGTYTVTLTVSNGPGSSNTKTMTNYITVYPQPTVSYTTNVTSGCPGTTVTFTNTSTAGAPGAATYLWNFGDGNSSTAQNPTNTYYASGNYNIALQVTNSAGCSKTILNTNYIHIFSKPAGNFTASNANSCKAPDTVIFTGTSTGAAPNTYAWDYGDVTTGTGANPTHIYTASGNYTVKMVVTDGNGCKDTVQKSSYINILNQHAAFTYPSSACVGTDVSFTNTSVGNPTSATWYFGDGGSATTTDGLHTYATAGTYNVKLVIEQNGCKDSIIHPITINPAPVPNFTSSPVMPCPAPSLVSFTNTTTGGATYKWDIPGYGTSTTTNTSRTFNGDSLYYITLVATSANGCKDSVTKSITIYDLFAQIYASKLKGCAPLNVDFQAFAKTHTSPPTYSSINNYPAAITNYVWDFGDGTATSTSATPNHTFATAGTYWIKVTITTANGCSHTDSMEIVAGNHPTANFKAIDTITCYSNKVHFTNLSTNASAYLWTFYDGGSSTVSDPDYQFTQLGTWTVKLKAIDRGCEDSMVKTNYVTVLGAKAKFNMAYSCDTPQLVKFVDSSKSYTSRVWYFGDGSSDTSANPKHLYPALGSYSGKLVVFNSVTGCADTAYINVNLIIPTPVFTADDTAICTGDTVKFTASNLTNILQINWTMDGHLFPDTTATIRYRFADTGMYTITLSTLDVNQCMHYSTRTKYVHVSRPYVNFGATPLVGCTPLPVNFTDSTKGIAGTTFPSHTWNYGDGTTGTANNHTYTTAGIYDVKLYVTDNVGCTDSFSRTGYIQARHPHADFTASTTAPCIGTNVVFTNNSTSPVAMTYDWSFGDGGTSNAGTANHTYTQTGTFTVRLIVTDISGCKDTMIKTNYISVTKPHASFTVSDTLAICPPLLAQFTNTSTGAVGQSWDFGNGGSSVVPNPTNPYNTPGQYTVTMIATDAHGCTDTAKANVKVLGYAGALSYTPLMGCVPLTVNFTANISNVPTLIWDFSDGTTQPSIGATTTHTYTTMGAYVPKLIISDGLGCNTSSLGLDTIKVDDVVADFIYSQPACIGVPVQLTDKSVSPFSSMSQWSWTFDDNTTSASQPTYHTWNTPGSYPVKFIGVNNNGCRDTVTKNVTIQPLPVISAGNDTAICLSDAATLRPSGGASYTWNTDPTLSCTNCTNPSATPTVNTTYIVVGTGANGCQNTDTVNVRIKTKTESSVGPGGEICAGAAFQLHAIGGQRWEWSPSASIKDPKAQDPIANPVVTTNFMMIAYEGSCIPDTHYVNVITHPLPVMNAGADEKVVAGNPTQLMGMGINAEKFAWSPAYELSCDSCPNPTASLTRTTEFTLYGFTDFGCVDSDKVTIQVLCDQSQAFIPNTFTPNGDGHNDYFYPRGKGIEKIKAFRIYNRWGQIVYEKTSFEVNEKFTGWDGTQNGKPLNADVFVYVIEATCTTGEPLQWKGDITLIR